MTRDERHVWNRLTAYRVEIDAILRGLRVGEWLATTREHYRVLKERMREDSRSLRTTRRDPELTSAEQRWYCRPVQHAAAHLLAPVNANTDKIRHSLGKARADIALGISRMKYSVKRR
jgi:hypothetical protein